MRVEVEQEKADFQNKTESLEKIMREMEKKIQGYEENLKNNEKENSDKKNTLV